MLKRIAIAVALLSSPVAEAHFAQAPAQVEARVSQARVVKALAARRAKNLAAFRAYRKAGVYPHNYVRRGPLNVWMDMDGHLCAAATVMDKDGKHDLVLATAKKNNFIRLQNVTEGPLMDWILTSGFTLEELDRIQEPMTMDDRTEPDYKLADAQLAKSYAATDAWLVQNTKASLARAASRLMENPSLARRLVDGTL